MPHLLNLIKKEIKSHLGEYLLLLTCGVVFLLLLGFYAGEHAAMTRIMLIFCCTYIIWGISHHAVHRSLHINNVLEYVIVGFTFYFIFSLLF